MIFAVVLHNIIMVKFLPLLLIDHTYLSTMKHIFTKTGLGCAKHQLKKAVRYGESLWQE